MRLGRRRAGALLLGAVVATTTVCGVWANAAQASNFQTLNEKEAAAKARWLGAKFDGVDPTTSVAAPKVGIEVVKNHDPVLVDSRFDKKLKIGDKAFDKGLYCHAPSELIVRLSKKAKRFTAVVGIDTNAPETKAGGGSVKFAVKSNDVGLYESGLMTGGKAGASVDVALDGAQEFALLIDPQGNISCDQSDWADAKIEYEDGEVVYLSDLALTDSASYDRTFAVDFPFSFVYDGKSSREFLKDWKVERAKEELDGKVLRRLTLTEPGDRLQVACE
ncbi:MAG: NPCBM/NEW2 domain-containing protein, partial [Thermoguttaceae bacterium]|nr:NPCBM/NEW2 domain-containing protein [Thermoguttaceae bacterium]